MGLTLSWPNSSNFSFYEIVILKVQETTEYPNIGANENPYAIRSIDPANKGIYTPDPYSTIRQIRVEVLITKRKQIKNSNKFLQNRQENSTLS